MHRIKKYPPILWLIVLLASATSLGFILWGTDFAHIGLSLSLPHWLGRINNLNIKLFIFEQFLIFSGLIGLFYFNKKSFQTLIKNHLAQMVLILLLLSMTRLATSLSPNPILAIRNAAFCWYLFFALLMAFIPKMPDMSEDICFFSFLICLSYFLFTFIRYFASGEVWPILEVSFIGLYPFIYWSFTQKFKNLHFVFLTALGTFWGIQLTTKVQNRISLLGLLFVIILAAWQVRKDKRKKILLITRIGFLAIITILAGYLSKTTLKPTTDVSPFGNPLIKSESEASGMERYRYYMWRDALELFAQNPFWGIGFQKQVVYRRYDGGGDYLANDGRCNEEGTVCQPSIAGPHNSYLNALTRLGVVGLLFFVLHLTVLRRLIQNKYYWTAWGVFAQILYACFNIGLEGPIRSFLILLGTSSAISLMINKRTYEKRASTSS